MSGMPYAISKNPPPILPTQSLVLTYYTRSTQCPVHRWIWTSAESNVTAPSGEAVTFTTSFSVGADTA
eukprot:560608-Rhodomonas_salina.1